MSVRDFIFSIIEPKSKSTLLSRVYDYVMFAAIFIGIFPLMFREQTTLFYCFDIASCFCFIVDYLLRWLTADYFAKKDRKKWMSFVLYPVTPMAIVDLLSILPTFNVLSSAFKMARLSRLLRILRIFKVTRYFEPFEIIYAVIRKQSKILWTVFSLAVFYIFITALIMFNAEVDINPMTGEYLFTNYFDAFYWAACTLTTVGYGDIYPISEAGRVISIISSIVGIAIIALPSGVITAGYLDELRCRQEEKQRSQKNQLK